MANEYMQTSTTGYGTRIVNSIAGIILGLMLFLGSFVLLYLNEGTADLSALAQSAQEIQATAPAINSTLQESLVWTTGVLSSNEMIGDNLFLTPGNYIAIARSVEMYGWKENQHSTTQKNLGGSQTTQTTYTYVTEWINHPHLSHNFKHPEEHENPTPFVSDLTIKAQKATIGSYTIDMATITLPQLSPLTLNQTTITTTDQKAQLAQGHYIFFSLTGASTIENPQVGDLRIRYATLSSGNTGTIFGKLSGNAIVPYIDATNHTLYRIFSGTHDQAISTLHTEYSAFVWLLRVAGFLMMWIGLCLLAGPVSVILDIIPFLGSLSSMVIALVALLIALPLTTVTILISMILHNLIALIITCALTLILLIIGLKRFGKKKA